MFKKYLCLSATIHLIVLWGVGASLPPSTPGSNETIVLEFNLERPMSTESQNLAGDKQEKNKVVSEAKEPTGEKRDPRVTLNESRNREENSEQRKAAPLDPGGIREERQRATSSEYSIMEAGRGQPTPESLPEETNQVSPWTDVSTDLMKEELPNRLKDLNQSPQDSADKEQTELEFRKERLEQEKSSQPNLPNSREQPINASDTDLTEGEESATTPEAAGYPSTAQEKTGTYKEDPDQRPVLVKQKTPFYPLTARRKGWEGTVTIQVNLKQNGRVGEVQVLESSGYEILDKEAVKAVRHWRYTPAYQDGNPIDYQIIVKITFTLQN